MGICCMEFLFFRIIYYNYIRIDTRSQALPRPGSYYNKKVLSLWPAEIFPAQIRLSYFAAL